MGGVSGLEWLVCAVHEPRSLCASCFLLLLSASLGLTCITWYIYIYKCINIYFIFFFKFSGALGFYSSCCQSSFPTPHIYNVLFFKKKSQYKDNRKSHAFFISGWVGRKERLQEMGKTQILQFDDRRRGGTKTTSETSETVAESGSYPAFKDNLFFHYMYIVDLLACMSV